MAKNSMEMGMMFHVGGTPEEMDEATRNKVSEYVLKRVGGLRCPDHDKAPTVLVGGTRLDNVTFDVKGCCQKVVHLVKEKLAQ